MIKTQIQLPDELYRRVKAFAEQREWSLAETFGFDRVWNPLD